MSQTSPWMFDIFHADPIQCLDRFMKTSECLLMTTFSQHMHSPITFSIEG